MRAPDKTHSGNFTSLRSRAGDGVQPFVLFLAANPLSGKSHFIDDRGLCMAGGLWSSSLEDHQYNKSDQHECCESRDCESTLRLPFKKTKEFENKAVST
jgi:hypothetical protein